jgi:hypothetical membrane protein
VRAFPGIITVEALYPAYSTSQKAISDLGATEPPDSIIVQPSSAHLHFQMTITGLLIIGGTFFVHRTYNALIVSIPLTLLGIGILGVRIFPGNRGTVHAFFALIAFVTSGISAITSYRVESVPFR